MYLSRKTIKEFLELVEWATPKSFIILKNGEYTNKGSLPILVELARMARMGQIKRLTHHRTEAVYADRESKRYDVGLGNKFDHDNSLRHCLTRFLHDHPEAVIKIKNDKNADAMAKGFYFEMDRGNEDEEQLAAKLKDNYSDEGKYRVIFFMASRYSAETEQNRLNKLFEVLKKIKYSKPNRILGSCYSKYIENGKLYNRNREVQI